MYDHKVRLFCFWYVDFSKMNRIHFTSTQRPESLDDDSRSPHRRLLTHLELGIYRNTHPVGGMSSVKMCSTVWKMLTFMEKTSICKRELCVVIGFFYPRVQNKKQSALIWGYTHELASLAQLSANGPRVSWQESFKINTTGHFSIPRIKCWR